MKSGCLLIDWFENRSARLHHCRRRLFVLFSPCTSAENAHEEGKREILCCVRATPRWKNCYWKMEFGRICVHLFPLALARSLLNKQQAKDAERRTSKCKPEAKRWSGRK